MMELTKEDTKMIQGLCALAMVWLHLFDTWNYEGLFKPILFIRGLPVTVYIAQLSDFCVMGFACCSGYAHYSLLEEKDYYKHRLRSLFKLMIKYWIVLFVFTFISIFIGQKDFMPGSWKTFLLNCFFLNSYNGSWWYLFAYIVIVLISPALLKQIRKQSFWMIAICCGVLYCLSYYYRFNVIQDDIVLSKLGPLGMTLVEYTMGSMAAKYQYFTVMGKLWKKPSKNIRVSLSIITIIAMLLIRTLVTPSLFFAPVSGMILITLFHLWQKSDLIERILLLMGEKLNVYLVYTYVFLLVSVSRPCI